MSATNQIILLISWKKFCLGSSERVTGSPILSSSDSPWRCRASSPASSWGNSSSIFLTVSAQTTIFFWQGVTFPSIELKYFAEWLVAVYGCSVSGVPYCLISHGMSAITWKAKPKRRFQGFSLLPLPFHCCGPSPNGAKRLLLLILKTYSEKGLQDQIPDAKHYVFF